jgi:hypothetical protein
MAFVEGGAFKCAAHDFETESVKEWNDHCDGDPMHTEQGETLCVSCGDKVYFEDLPYHRINEKTGSKDISLKCEECDNKSVGKVKRSKSKSRGSKSEE